MKCLPLPSLFFQENGLLSVVALPIAAPTVHPSSASTNGDAISVIGYKDKVGRLENIMMKNVKDTAVPFLHFMMAIYLKFFQNQIQAGENQHLFSCEGIEIQSEVQ